MILEPFLKTAANLGSTSKPMVSGFLVQNRDRDSLELSSSVPGCCVGLTQAAVLLQPCRMSSSGVTPGR